jgi:cobalt-zinc-cadmium efflux system outer membrane protein
LLDQGVTKAYVTALLASTDARILTESAGYMRHEREIAEARLKAGDIAESDLKQIQVATGQYELQAKSAEAAAVQARIALEVLLGVNRPKGDSQLIDSFDEIPLEPPAASPSETTAARPDVIAAETDLRAAKESLKLQRAVRIPDPTFSVGYEHDPPGGGPPVDTVNFGVSFPLPIWNRNRGNISAAQAALDQSGFALEKIRAQAASDLSDSETAYREASERMQRYREQIRPQSAAARASVAYKYEKGGATLVDLLEAERTDNDVRIATAQALADTASAAASLAAARAAVSETELNSTKWQYSK